MRRMGRFDRLLAKVIIVLGGNGCTEGSYTDVRLQRQIKLYSRPQNNVLEGHYEEEITREFATTAPTTVKNAEQVQKERTIIAV